MKSRCEWVMMSLLCRPVALSPFAIAVSASLASFAGVLDASAQAPSDPPLRLEAKIPLGSVEGRIDHIALDAKREHLFVAELGNSTIAIVSLAARKVVGMITGIKEPQGVAYLPSSDVLYVASAGDGSVGIYDGASFALRNRIDLREDADNIRIDPNTSQVFVGYGSGAIAVIDTANNRVSGDIALKGHPESFQLTSDGYRILVNVPTAREVAVIDRAAGKQVGQWNLRYQGNFPMALDDQHQRVLVAFRSPPRLTALATQDGGPWSTVEICGDADDVFVDAKRNHIYVSCGEGVIDVVENRDAGLARLARIPTEPGARTALFSPDRDRLFLAVRASPAEPAGIWVFRPDP
jgi:DNA-binding beta-propeller fold protein YncE